MLTYPVVRKDILGEYISYGRNDFDWNFCVICDTKIITISCLLNTFNYIDFNKIRENMIQWYLICIIIINNYLQQLGLYIIIIVNYAFSIFDIVFIFGNIILEMNIVLFELFYFVKSNQIKPSHDIKLVQVQ